MAQPHITLASMQEMKGPGAGALGREEPLRWEMAACPRILAWKIPRTEESGRPQSVGLQRVGHD